MTISSHTPPDSYYTSAYILQETNQLKVIIWLFNVLYEKEMLYRWREINSVS